MTDPSAVPHGTMQDEVAGPLQRRLSPLVIALSSLLAVGAPVAHHVVGARELRADCHSIASRAAEDLAHEAQERPRLWRYDSIKILAHLRSYRAQASVSSMQVFDATGLAAGAAPSGAGVLWCSRAVRVRGEDVGSVWVAMHLRSLRAASLALLAVFTTLALALGSLVYKLSMRTARAAATRIDSLVGDLERSRAKLAELNAGLERDVAERTRELDEAYAELRTTAARAVTLQETERRAIGRDLHDSVGQALTAIRIHAQLASELAVESDESRAQREVLTKVCATTDAALEELRRALARLGPAVLDEVGLEASLHRALDAFVEQCGCEVERRLSVPEGLEPAVEVALYRVVQEALTNVARHADARTVRVVIESDEHAVRLRIEDDGVGITKGARGNGRGVHGMRERAELLRGSFVIAQGEGGRGTRIDVSLPRA
jgi:signal transduction histidine kinase